MRVLLIGHYGQRNLGDDLFAVQLSRYFRSRGDSVSVLCRQPIAELDRTVRQIPDLGARWSTLWTSITSSLLVFGGGSIDLSHEPTSLLRLCRASRLVAGRFVLFGVGLELATGMRRRNYTRLLRLADTVCVRDEESRRIAETVVGANRVRLGGDVALMDLDLFAPFRRSSKGGIQGSPRHVAFSGVSWMGPSRIHQYEGGLRALAHKGARIHFLPACGGEGRSDNIFNRQLAQRLPPASWELHAPSSSAEYLRLLSAMDLLVSARLHSVVAADVLGVPSVAIRYAPKVEIYLKRSQTPAMRLLPLDADLSVERMLEVARDYVRPAGFLEAESRRCVLAARRAFRRRTPGSARRARTQGSDAQGSDSGSGGAPR